MNLKKYLQKKLNKKETATARPVLERAMLPKVETRLKRANN